MVNPQVRFLAMNVHPEPLCIIPMLKHWSGVTVHCLHKQTNRIKGTCFAFSSRDVNTILEST